MISSFIAEFARMTSRRHRVRCAVVSGCNRSPAVAAVRDAIGKKLVQRDGVLRLVDVPETTSG
jgi:hypothetical protein